jgi:hypothetical protein
MPFVTAPAERSTIRRYRNEATRNLAAHPQRPKDELSVTPGNAMVGCVAIRG